MSCVCSAAVTGHARWSRRLRVALGAHHRVPVVRLNAWLVGHQLPIVSLCQRLVSGLGLGSAASSTGPRYVIGEPLRLGRREGCLWIDLDERVVDSQKTREDSQTVVVGGSRTIPEVQNFAKRRLRRTASDNSQSFFGMKWVIIPKNSSDLGHYFLPSPG